jgi:hypothetical protein
MDGYDPSGLMILKKERTWLEEGQKVGEHVLPLARNFNDVDIEAENSSVEMKMSSSSSYDIDSSSSKDEMSRKYGSAREAITNKYAAIREQQSRNSPSTVTKPETMASAKVSLLETDVSGPSNGEGGGSGSGEPSSRLASTWRNMKLGIQSFKENVATKKFLPLRQGPETTAMTSTSARVTTPSIPQSLDEIFQRLKNRSVEHGHYLDDDDDVDYEDDVRR